MLFDTHSHLFLWKLSEREKEVLENMEKNNVKYFTNIWTDLETSKKSISFAKKYKNSFATVWIHPCNVYDLDLEKSIEILEKYILENKEVVVWIWETGLDYYWLKPENDEKIAKYSKIYQEKIINLKKKLQKIFFIAQINLAKKYDLVVVIHNRESAFDIFEVLKETNCKKFIFHCYSENLDYAKKLIEFAPESKISFSGIITFKNAFEITETVRNISLKNILIETDAPYLTPIPFRWKKENEPAFVKYILEKIIEIREEKPEIIEKQIFENSLEIFKIKK